MLILNTVMIADGVDMLTGMINPPQIVSTLFQKSKTLNK